MKLDQATISAAKRELYRRDFRAYIPAAWPSVVPDPFQGNWHIDAMAEHFQAVAEGHINRLVINVPPGSSKSTVANVLFPSWLWGPFGDPKHKFIGAAHEQGLAIRDNRLMRELILSPWYQDLWPIALQGDQNEKLYFENQHRGFRQACAVASMTGRRGHTVVWDDPLSPEKAHYETTRETAIRVLRETLPLRLNDPKTSAIIIIMQRLHQNDPTGFVIEQEFGYEHLMIPMEFEPERKCYTSIGWEDPRAEPGELMFPDRFPREVVERDKKVLGEYGYAGQMQQRPAPRGGGMFPVDRFQIIEHAPAASQVKKTVRYWDKAGTAGGGARTAGVKMSLLKDGRYFVEDVRVGQWGALDRERRIKQTAEIDGKLVKVYIEQEPGSGGKESAEATIRNLAGWSVKADKVTGNKELRADPYASQVQGENVLLLRAPWNQEFLDEHEVFPNGTYMDQVDAASGAFAFLAPSKKKAGAW
jgi:predicted phage terminase large subunit-like protein